MPIRVAVIGAGAIGLATAWRLAQRGVRVDVYERDTAGGGDDVQRWLSRAEVAGLEPALANTATAARLCPNDHQVDARRLAAALAEAVRRAGGVIHEHTAAGVDVPNADVVVLAAGAWT